MVKGDPILAGTLHNASLPQYILLFSPLPGSDVKLKSDYRVSRYEVTQKCEVLKHFFARKTSGF
jgi:hypothetical protein